MKHILILFYASLISCTLGCEKSINVEIKNASDNVIRDFQFKSGETGFRVDSIRANETYSKKIAINFSENNGHYWSMTFKRDTESPEELGCADILTDRKNRILKIKITNEEIDTDYNGACF